MKNPQQTSHTEKIFGIRWQDHLPAAAGEYTFELSSYEEFSAIKNAPDSFLVTSENAESSFLPELSPAFKENYLRHVADFFVFRKNGEVVGVAISDVLDWTTYYLRFVFIKKEHRFHGLTEEYSRITEEVCRKHAVEKLACDVSPANLAQVTRLSRIGWTFAGNNLSERFGANLRLIRFLNTHSQNTYLRNFTRTFKSVNRRDEKTSSHNNKGVVA